MSARGDGKVPWRALTRLTGQIARANRVRAVRARMGVRHTIEAGEHQLHKQSASPRRALAGVRPSLLQAQGRGCQLTLMRHAGRTGRAMDVAMGAGTCRARAQGALGAAGAACRADTALVGTSGIGRKDKAWLAGVQIKRAARGAVGRHLSRTPPLAESLGGGGEARDAERHLACLCCAGEAIEALRSGRGRGGERKG